MSDKSKIEWTDATWGIIDGCTKVSTGCRSCYAERIADRFWGDRKFTDVRFHPERLDQPLRWKKPRRIFVSSMSDLFHESVKVDQIRAVFAVMMLCPWHTFIVLTKRPERMLEMINPKFHGDASHIHICVSVENQATADERIPILLQIPAAVRGVSYEPGIAPVDFSKIVMPDGDHLNNLFNHGTGTGIGWVIIGCESGPQRRPMPLDWARSAVQQCKAAGVAVFVKQLDIGGKCVRDMAKFPPELQIREYPT